MVWEIMMRWARLSELNENLNYMKAEEKIKLEAQVELNKVFKEFVEQIEQLVAKP